MEVTAEIIGHLKNIRYYSDKIASLAALQYNNDYARGQKAGINTGPGTTRFEALACIITATDYQKVYCDNIESNVKTAEEQDKLLWGEDYKEEEET